MIFRHFQTIFTNLDLLLDKSNRTFSIPLSICDEFVKLALELKKELLKKQKELLQGIFQMDETYIKTDNDDRGGGTGKRSENNTPVVAISSEGYIKALKAKDLTSTTLYGIARRTAKEGSTFHTDSSSAYGLFKNVFTHEKVKHAVEFVNRDGVHCNSVEGFWSLLKRGIRGNYHHISQKYLQNYINEFEYRYNACGSDDLGFSDMVGRMLLQK